MCSCVYHDRSKIHLTVRCLIYAVFQTFIIIVITQRVQVFTSFPLLLLIIIGVCECMLVFYDFHTV